MSPENEGLSRCLYRRVVTVLCLLAPSRGRVLQLRGDPVRGANPRRTVQRLRSRVSSRVGSCAFFKDMSSLFERTRRLSFFFAVALCGRSAERPGCSA